MTQLAEAMKKAGIPERFAKPAQPINERSSQVFRMSVTKFEIPVLLVVKASDQKTGMDFVRDRKLNTITTRCKDFDEAKAQVWQKILDWYNEDVARQGGTVDGSLLWYRTF